VEDALGVAAGNLYALRGPGLDGGEGVQAGLAQALSAVALPGLIVADPGLGADLVEADLKLIGGREAVAADVGHLARGEDEAVLHEIQEGIGRLQLEGDADRAALRTSTAPGARGGP